MNSIYNNYKKLISDEDAYKFLDKYLNVPSLLRLKRISYFCGMDYASKDIYDFKEKLTRFDHSLTVALLTWRFTHDKSQTLAGLFHDIATPCFSHVIDYMNKDYKSQESTEEKTSEIILKDKLLRHYLEKDNIDINAVIDFKSYSIVDNNRPMLCADRLDGIILTGLGWTKRIDNNDVIKIINSLDIFLNEDEKLEIGFNDRDTALLTLNKSNEIDEYCHSNEDNFMMELLADITRNAIIEKIIDYDDLYYLNENIVFDLIKKYGSDNLLNKMYIFENIKKENIPLIKLENVKVRDLNPLVNGKRLLSYMYKRKI